MRSVRHLTFANVASGLALTLAATTGGAYAAAGLAPGSVGTAQLKNNAVVSAKVKDRSPRAADFARGQLPAGPAGARGPRGLSAWDPIPSGTLVSGIFWYETTTGTISINERFWTAFPGKAPRTPQIFLAPDNTAATSGENPACAGQVDAQVVPAGALCVYLVQETGVDTFQPVGLDPSGRNGFLLQVITDDVNTEVEVYGHWAYRAP